MASESTSNQLETDIATLKGQQKIVSWICWGVAISGLLFFISGFYIKSHHTDWDYDNLGTYLAGTAGSIWALAGLLFIYLGFIGQKIEIKQQQIELQLTREQMADNTRALESQDRALKEQSMHLAKQNDALQKAWIFESVKSSIERIKDDLQSVQVRNRSSKETLVEFFDSINSCLPEHPDMIYIQPKQFQRDHVFMEMFHTNYIILSTTYNEINKFKDDPESREHLIAYLNWAVYDIIPRNFDILILNINDFLNKRNERINVPHIVMALNMIELLGKIHNEWRSIQPSS